MQFCFQRYYKFRVFILLTLGLMLIISPFSYADMVLDGSFSAKLLDKFITDETNVSQIKDSLKYAGDASNRVLSSIFGYIPMAISVDSGGASLGGLIGWIIGYFNTVLIGVSASIISLSVVMGAIYSSTDGKAMGKLASAWVPVRSVVGASFLFPAFGGFSTIQVMMATIIVAGSSFADLVWFYSFKHISSYSAFNQDAMTDILQGGTNNTKYQNKVLDLAATTSNVYSTMAKSYSCYEFYKQSFTKKDIKDTVFVKKRNSEREIVFPKVSDFNGVNSGEGWVYPKDCGSINFASNETMLSFDYDIVQIKSFTDRIFSKYEECSKNNSNGQCTKQELESYLNIENEINNMKILSKSAVYTALARKEKAMTLEKKAAAASDEIYKGPSGKTFGPSWIYAAFSYYDIAFEYKMQSSSVNPIDMLNIDNDIFSLGNMPKLKGSDMDTSPTKLTIIFELLDDFKERLSANILSERSEERSEPKPNKHQKIDEYIGKYNSNEKFELSSSLLNMIPRKQVFPEIGFLTIEDPKLVSLPSEPLTPEEQAKRWGGAGCLVGALNAGCQMAPGPVHIPGAGWLTLNTFLNASYGLFTSFDIMPKVASEWIVHDIYSFTYFTSQLWYDTFVNNPRELIFNPIAKITDYSVKMLVYTLSFMFNTIRNIVNEGLAQARRNVSYAVLSSIASVVLDTLGTWLKGQGWNLLTTCYLPQYYGLDLMGCLTILIFFVPVFVWLIVGAIAMALGIVLSVIANSLLGTITQFYYMMVQYALAAQFKYIGLIMGITSPILAFVGGMMFYIPFIPLIFYNLAVIGWVVLSLEAMLGIPLMLLGMVNPKGHDLLGTAQQSLMMMLSVFLRPVTIVMGFIFALIMSSVAMLMFNTLMIPSINMYLDVMYSMTKDNQLVFGIIIFMMMFFSLLIVRMLLNYSFTLVYSIPMNVMKWLGMPARPTDQDVAQQIEQASDSAASSVGQGFSAMGDKTKQSMGSLGNARMLSGNTEGQKGG